MLVNQAPHVIDRYLWLFGMPESVVASCESVLHDIEVEDTASALLRHAHGFTGYLHVNTNELPAVSRMSIQCDRGRIEVENGRLRLVKLSQSVEEWTRTATVFSGDPESEVRDLDASLIVSPIELIGRFYTNLALAAAGEEALSVTVEESRGVVEIMNAILLSNAEGRSISLPIDRKAYETFIADRVLGGVVEHGR